ncbi:MAG TPA: UDP-3-O-acyl-N-acetylglucosamine deacetylase, partial [Longimicrobium sp.]|nr:UDP-3-O-acyl-N-acetylglucosamine deacetylase [Longimicrobium sp.]
DLALLGLPVIGALVAVKSGHALNQALVRKVLADPSTHRVVQINAEADAPALRAKVPALARPEGQVA